MYAKIVCSPPLGQPTIVPAGQEIVDFIVLLETTADSVPNKPWQVALWHDLGTENGEWSALNFEETSRKHEIVSFPP
jgi:hypothetical protein